MIFWLLSPPSEGAARAIAWRYCGDWPEAWRAVQELESPPVGRLLFVRESDKPSIHDAIGHALPALPRGTTDGFRWVEGRDGRREEVVSAPALSDLDDRGACCCGCGVDPLPVRFA